VDFDDWDLLIDTYLGQYTIILIDSKKVPIKIKQRARHFVPIRDYTDFAGVH
jgi:hypothetical protein